MNAAPEQVVRAIADGVARLIVGVPDAQRVELVDRLASLYAETTDVRHPFAPSGSIPLRTRSQVREHFDRIRVAGVERMGAVGTVHLTADPELVVYEFGYVGRADGQDVRVPCVFVTRVRDGLVVESRDHADHVAMARAFGGLDRLADRLAAEAAASGPGTRGERPRQDSNLRPTD